MVNYIKERFALSDKGAKDLVKAIISCTISDIVLMLPVSLIYLVLKNFLSPLLGGEDMKMNVVLYTGFVIGILAIIYLTQYIQYNSTYIASYDESANKRIHIAERLRKIPLSFFGKKDLTDLTTTIMGDCTGIEQGFSHYIPQFIGSFISLIFISIGLAFMNVKMTIALLWVFPVSMIIVLISKKYQDKLNKLNKESQLDCRFGIQECIDNIKEIKANNQCENYMKLLEEKLITSEKRSIKAEYGAAIFVTSAQMILRIGIVSVVFAGVILLQEGAVDLLTFIVFLIAASRIFEPLSTSFINLSAIYLTILQADRMKKIENEKIQEGLENEIYSGYDITFKDVDFSYNNEEQVLRNISFIAKQGEVTALVGPSGSGKSTITRLGARFWDIDGGKITIGDTDISTVDAEKLLNNISIVFQDVILFNNTVMENIRIGKKNATDEEVIEAAKAAQCDKFIMEMPNGYETIIGENGSMLSGGERQRISIARALLKDAPIIFLDEATASLDVENETLVQKAISTLIKNKTVLVIAHRVRTISMADKIVVLDKGKIIEEGKHEELIKKNGLYKKMVDIQKRSDEWSL